MCLGEWSDNLITFIAGPMMQARSARRLIIGYRAASKNYTSLYQQGSISDYVTDYVILYEITKRVLSITPSRHAMQATMHSAATASATCHQNSNMHISRNKHC